MLPMLCRQCHLPVFCNQVDRQGEQRLLAAVVLPQPLSGPLAPPDGVPATPLQKSPATREPMLTDSLYVRSPYMNTHKAGSQACLELE